MLLRTPATTHEINVVRKHLSRIKGGQLAAFVYPATCVALYISDIIGDSFDIQASGPTAPDSSTFREAANILKKYDVWRRAPLSIRRRFHFGVAGRVPETPKKNHPAFKNSRAFNVTIANHQTAVSVAVRTAQKLGYHTIELTSSIHGEARVVARRLTSIGKRIQRGKKRMRRPAMVIAGGETTVTVRGNGKGGRNQELVMSAIPLLTRGMTLASFGTDGVDGITPRPVAGAIADASTRECVFRKKLSITDFLRRNDSYNFFQRIDGHITTGPTGTNLGDVLLLSIL